MEDAERDAGAPEPASRPAAEAEPVRHVVFRLASERYALPLDAVREVVVPQAPFARVPRASEAVRGVMNLRGRVVAVVDLASLVGLPPQPLVGSIRRRWRGRVNGTGTRSRTPSRPTGRCRGRMPW